ncbi:MAG: hypothetical protein ACLTLQ_19380 [[Clostridium] scindens]|uniref:hypothetical protein n=1 Tax=Clostridium scindens (strain JCM 10418 / VPI 12708) TaxID=29347 RepID=UPI0039945929
MAKLRFRRKLIMQNVIEKAVFKITQEMERNRKDYNETADCYRDTGYDRYWDKMERLEKEYEELKSFLGLNSSTQNASAESTRLYAENKELKRFINDAKSLMTYIHADYWSDPQVQRLYEKFRDFN